MHNLPLELMTMPFRFLCHSEIVSLMLVSKRWQHVISGTPSLWTALALRIDDAESAILKKWLCYSGNLRISVSLTIPLAHESALSGVCTMLGPHLHRFRHLGVHGERISYCSSILSLLHIPAPNLVSLDLSPTRFPSARSRFFTRLDDVTGPDAERLLHQVAPRLQTLDLGLLNSPGLLQTVLPCVKSLSFTLTAFVSLASAPCFSYCPLLEHVVVKDHIGLHLRMPLWPGHPLRSIVIHQLADLGVDWSFISQYDATSVCVKQRHEATYHAIMDALADGDWQILSLTMDYGLAVTAAFRSGDRIRYLQSHDYFTQGSPEMTCATLMYEPRCLRHIRELTLSLALEPVNQALTGHVLPHLQLPALVRITLICGAPHIQGRELGNCTLLDGWALNLASRVQAQALKQIVLAPRRASSSPLVHAYDGPRQYAAVSPSRLAEFVKKKVECKDPPELRVGAPDVYLSNDPAGLQELVQVVSGIIYSL